MQLFCTSVMLGEKCNDPSCELFHPSIPCRDGNKCPRVTTCSFYHSEQERMDFIVRSRSTMSPLTIDSGDNNSSTTSLGSWVQHRSRTTGKIYWYNTISQESTYDNPVGFSFTSNDVSLLIKTDRENSARILNCERKKNHDLWVKLEERNNLISKLTADVVRLEVESSHWEKLHKSLLARRNKKRERDHPVDLTLLGKYSKN